jgi:hypothetical protein
MSYYNIVTPPDARVADSSVWDWLTVTVQDTVQGGIAHPGNRRARQQHLVAEMVQLDPSDPLKCLIPDPDPRSPEPDPHSWFLATSYVSDFQEKLNKYTN